MDSETIARVREKLEDAVKGHNNDRVFEALGEIASLLPNALASPYAGLLGSEAPPLGEQADAPFAMAPARTLGVIAPGFEIANAATSGMGPPLGPRRTQQSIGNILQHDPSAGPTGGWSAFETIGPESDIAAGASGADKLALVGPLLVRWIGDGLERMVEARLRFQAEARAARTNGDAQPGGVELADIGDVLDGWTTRAS